MDAHNFTCSPYKNRKSIDMKQIISLFILFLVISILLSSCAKQNEQELGGATTCDNNNMTYTANIKPILQNFCFSCHGNGLSQNGINFDTYASVKSVADNGKLVGSISHTAGFAPMPQSAPKLSDCNINKIKNWVSSGALNN